MSQFTHYLAIIVPIGRRGAAQTLTASLYSDQGNAREAQDSFLTELSATGNLPATHAAMCGLVTARQAARFNAAFGGVTGLKYWSWDQFTERLTATNQSDTLTTAWNWAACLASANLKTMDRGGE